MSVTSQDPHVQERLEATRARWQREVDTAKDKLAAAVMDERLAGQRMMETDPDSDEWDGVVAAHFRVIDRRHAAQQALDRISADHELQRRLENSESLARRFR